MALISITQAAERLGVGRMTIWTWLTAKNERQRLRGQRIGHGWVVEADDLERAASTYKRRRARGPRGVTGEEKTRPVTS